MQAVVAHDQSERGAVFLIVVQKIFLNKIALMKKPSQLGLNIGNRLLYPILNGGPTNIYSYIFLHEYKLFAYNQKQDIFSLLTQMSSHNKKPMDQKAASRIQVRIMHLKFFPNHFEKKSIHSLPRPRRAAAASPRAPSPQRPSRQLPRTQTATT